MASDLSPGERRALEALSAFGTVKQAAAAIGRSPRTVENQLASVRGKLGARSTLQAIVMLDDRQRG